MLNELLYRRLCARLPGGVISIANENEPPELKFSSRSLRVGRPHKELCGGEEYVCICPFCGDRSGHLYVNHRYGDYDRTTGEENTHLAICFRRRCLDNYENRKALARRVFGDMPADQRRAFTAPKDLPPRPPATLSVIPVPGNIVPISSLANDHQASLYLRRRGFDLNELDDRWQVGWCPPPADVLATNRIYIPMMLNGVLVGWQARWPDDLRWKETGVRKYQNRKGFRKSLYLYGHDQARLFPYLAIVEGCTDVWKAGPPAVSLLGKTLSEAQCDLIVKRWGRYPIGICLDNDDPDAPMAAKKVYERLAERGACLPFLVTLPNGRDPGDMRRDEFWECYRRWASGVSINLPPMLGEVAHAGR